MRVVLSFYVNQVVILDASMLLGQKIPQSVHPVLLYEWFQTGDAVNRPKSTWSHHANPCEPSESYPPKTTTSYIKEFISTAIVPWKKGPQKKITAFGFSWTFPDGSSSSWSKVDSPSTNKASKLVPGPCSVSWNHTMEPSRFPKTHKIRGKNGRVWF